MSTNFHIQTFSLSPFFLNKLIFTHIASEYNNVNTHSHKGQKNLANELHKIAPQFSRFRLDVERFAADSPTQRRRLDQPEKSQYRRPCRIIFEFKRFDFPRERIELNLVRVVLKRSVGDFDYC
jgi:hypothetical protein